jgi:hypothetical protein
VDPDGWLSLAPGISIAELGGRLKPGKWNYSTEAFSIQWFPKLDNTVIEGQNQHRSAIDFIHTER